MAINTLITIKDAIDLFVAGHGQLRRVEWEADDHRAPIITSGDEFPMLFIAPIDVVIGRAMNIHTLRVYVYERINDDRLDVVENANDTSLLLRDIRVWWNDYGDDDIVILDDPTGIFISDRELDNLVGYYADIRFEIPSHGRCKVPVSVTHITPSSCEPSTFDIHSMDDTTLYSGYIPSGGFLDQPIKNSIIQLVDSNLDLIEQTEHQAESNDQIVAPDTIVNYKNQNLDLLGTVNYLSNSNQDLLLDNSTAQNSDSSFVASEQYGNVIILPDTTYDFIINGVTTSTTLPTLKNEIINIVWQ